jgi:hypothetical protein
VIRAGGASESTTLSQVGKSVERLAGGAQAERLAVGAQTDLVDELGSFELPSDLLDRLTPPLAQLGFAFAPERLPAGAFPKPLSYTLARNGGTSLVMLHLPDFFFRATSVVVFAATGLGYAFGASSRLHIFAKGRDAVPQYLETVISTWEGFGIVARFHPWMRLGELEGAADPAAFVTQMFDLAGGPPVGDGAARELTFAQYNKLHAALRSAFDDEEALGRMLRQQLGRALVDLAAPGRLPDRITEVIEEAQSGGWVRELVEGALREKPGNPELREFAQDFGVPLPA